MLIPTLSDVREAYKQIRSRIHRTPVLMNRQVNERSGGKIFLKCENFQKVGAFKIRGASYAISQLSDEETKHGVATHSSGNHAQAVALAARQKGIPAYIAMPENAPKVKVNAVKDYGANITFCESTQEARESTLQEIVDETGASFIHPYNSPHIITGQGTAALELLSQQPHLDAVLAPVGGGGLMSGTAITISEISPQTTIIGTEPEVANDAYLSFKSGTLHPVQSTETVADGLRTSLSELTFACIQKHVDDIIMVPEQQIIDAMRFVWERMKIIIEPSSAVPIAAAFHHLNCTDKKIGIIISGGNIDLNKLPWNDHKNTDIAD